MDSHGESKQHGATPDGRRAPAFPGPDRSQAGGPPANAGRLGLAGREGVLEMLFERLTLAYLTLIQTDRRKVYDRDLDPGAWGAAAFGAGAEQRREEVRGVAQGYYQR